MAQARRKLDYEGRAKPVSKHFRPYYSDHPKAYILSETGLPELTKLFGAKRATDLLSGRIRITPFVGKQLETVTRYTQAEWAKIQWNHDLSEILEPMVTDLELRQGASSVCLFFHWYTKFNDVSTVNLATLLERASRAKALAILSFNDNAKYTIQASKHSA